MDPHNLLLEIVLRYGAIAMILFVICWLWILVRGFLPRRPVADWRAAFGLTVVMLFPVLGVVPSSTLRYHVTWLYLVAASCITAETVAANGAGRPTLGMVRDAVTYGPGCGDATRTFSGKYGSGVRSGIPGRP